MNWLLKPIDREFNVGAYNRFSSLRKRITDIDFIDRATANSQFNINTLNHLGIYTINPTQDDCSCCEEFFKAHARVDSTGFFKRVVCRCYTGELPSINDVALPHNQHGNHYCCIPIVYGGRKDDRFAVCGKDSAGKNSPVVNFATAEEAENFKKSLNTTFYSYANWCYKINIRQTLNKLPWFGNAVNPRTGLLGYKGEWTDNDLWLYFGFSSEEKEAARTVLNYYDEF